MHVGLSDRIETLVDAEESIYHIKYGITTAKVNQNLDKCFLNLPIPSTTNKFAMQFVNLSLHVRPWRQTKQSRTVLQEILIKG